MNKFDEIKEKVVTVLIDLGVMIENLEEDIDLREYIQESIQFISFIVQIEQVFDIELDDSMLLMDSISSLNGFVTNLVENYL